MSDIEAYRINSANWHTLTMYGMVNGTSHDVIFIKFVYEKKDFERSHEVIFRCSCHVQLCHIFYNYVQKSLRTGKSKTKIPKIGSSVLQLAFTEIFPLIGFVQVCWGWNYTHRVSFNTDSSREILSVKYPLTFDWVIDLVIAKSPRR